MYIILIFLAFLIIAIVIYIYKIIKDFMSMNILHFPLHYSNLNYQRNLFISDACPTVP